MRAVQAVVSDCCVPLIKDEGDKIVFKASFFNGRGEIKTVFFVFYRGGQGEHVHAMGTDDIIRVEVGLSGEKFRVIRELLSREPRVYYDRKRDDYVLKFDGTPFEVSVLSGYRKAQGLSFLDEYLREKELTVCTVKVQGCDVVVTASDGNGGLYKLYFSFGSMWDAVLTWIFAAMLMAGMIKIRMKPAGRGFDEKLLLDCKKIGDPLGGTVVFVGTGMRREKWSELDCYIDEQERWLRYMIDVGNCLCEVKKFVETEGEMYAEYALGRDALELYRVYSGLVDMK